MFFHLWEMTHKRKKGDGMERLLVWIEHISDWLCTAANHPADGDGVVFHYFAERFSISLSFIHFQTDNRQRRKKAEGRGHSHTASGIDLSPQFNDRCSEHCRCARRYYVWGTGSGFLDVAYCLICHGD